MGNHHIGQAFAAAADVFWMMVPEGTTPTKEQALGALEAMAGEGDTRFRGMDAEFDDELLDDTTPLGRLVAIAFDASPDERPGESGDDDAYERWCNGPLRRFYDYFEFC